MTKIKNQSFQNIHLFLLFQHLSISEDAISFNGSNILFILKNAKEIHNSNNYELKKKKGTK